MLEEWIPTVRELSNADRSAARELPVPPGVEVGVIAVTLDHAVAEESTHLEGEADHLVIPGMHSMVPYQSQAHAQILHFLEHGRFAREDDE